MLTIKQSTITPLRIEYATTADMPDGQPLPPLIESGIPWRVVRRRAGFTLWRRLSLTAISEMSS